MILITGFLRGLHRGLVIELFDLIGFVAATVVAILFTQPLTDLIDQVVSNQLVNSRIDLLIKWLIFAGLFLLTSKLVRVIRNAIRPITKLPIISQLNGLLGGGINLISHYLLIFILLNFLIILPSQVIHQQYNQSSVSQWIVTQTPILSDKMIQIWDRNGSKVTI